jgi:hypothetical protein
MSLTKTPSRHFGAAQQLRRFGTRADMDFGGSREGFMLTRPSVMGPMVSSLPSKRRAAELMLLSVVDAWPPHHAVRGSGEPI